MSDRKAIDWTLIIVTLVMCGAFGLVQIIEANNVSADEFRRWFGSLATGAAGIGAYKYIRGA